MNSSGDRPRDLAREYGLSPQERAEVERLRGLRSQTSASRPQPSSSGAHGASKSGAANGTGSSRGRADAAQPVWLAAADLERLRKDGGTTEFAQNGSTWRVNEFFQANTLTDMAQSVLGELHRAQEATAASLRRASAAARERAGRAADFGDTQTPASVSLGRRWTSSSASATAAGPGIARPSDSEPHTGAQREREAAATVGRQSQQPQQNRRRFSSPSSTSGSGAWALLRKWSQPFLGGDTVEASGEDEARGPTTAPRRSSSAGRTSPPNAPSPPPEPRVTLSMLPDELLILIFSRLGLEHLPNVSLVCARFSDLRDIVAPHVIWAQGPESAAAAAQRADVPLPVRASLTHMLANHRKWDQLADVFATACADGVLDLAAIVGASGELHPACWSQGLVRACQYAREDVVELLLSHPAVDPADDECTAVRAACEGGSVRIVKMLVADDRVDVAKCGITCFKAALSQGHTHIAEVLLQHPDFDPAANDNELIRWVCKFGRADAVSMLFDDGRVDVTVNEQEAFRQACAQGHAAVVRLLLGLDCVDPSTEDNYAVKLAASNGHSDVLALLLADPRVDPTAGNNHAARFACMEGHAECVTLLLMDGRADFAADENQALRWAAASGRTVIVKMLLDSGKVDPHACDNSAIRLAHQYGHTEVLHLLMRDDHRRLTPLFSFR